MPKYRLHICQIVLPFYSEIQFERGPPIIIASDHSSGKRLNDSGNYLSVIIGWSKYHPLIGSPNSKREASSTKKVVAQ
jgi:hypothetical protein